MGRLQAFILIALVAFFPATRPQATFRDSPASAVVLEGFPTSLSCTAHQPAPSSIQWQRNGEQVEGGSEQRLSISYDSLTGRSELRVARVAYEDAGLYTCRALDATDSVIGTSQEANITVRGIPTVDIPSPVIVPLGGTAVLECRVLSNPPALITWSYDLGTVTRSLTTEGRVSIAPENVLTLTNAQEADAGYYSCSAWNTFGRNTTSARLQIGVPLGPFEATITPSDQDPLQVREGESASLRCTVPAGTPLSSITWTRASGANLAQVTRVDSGLVLAIQAASAETTDLYACTVVDVSGNSVVRTISVQVLIPPRFTEVPANITSAVNSSLKEPGCTAEGVPSPTITWFGPNLTALPGGLQLNFLTRQDAGTYTCLAANSVGEIRTQFTITVEGPPLVSIVPASVSSPPGDDILFRCVADGVPVPNSSWSRVASDLPFGSLSSPTSLRLFGVSAQDAGTYVCSATNVYGLGVAQASLTVLANPEITSISASPVVVPALSPLTLSCSASPATSLTWYLNSTRLAPDLDSNLFIQQDGTLVVSSANISYTGTYTCNVSTSFTFVVSQVEVVVGVSPGITAAPSDADLSPGASTTLQCQVSGFPHPHTTWRRTDPVSRAREELDIVGPTHIQLSTGLMLLNVSIDDSGVYECEASNAIGSSMEQATVRIQGAPLATSIGPNTTIPTNTTATLTCSLPLNFPLATISWETQAGGPLPPGRYSVSESGVLTISPVLVEDAGIITCTATNEYGQSSTMATVSVLFPPIVTTPLPAVDLLLDDSLVLPCSVLGNPEPTLSWIFPDGTTAGSKGVPVTSSGGIPVNNAEASDSGTYRCVGTNQLGVSSDTTVVTVVGARIEGLSVIVESTTALRVEWTQPSFTISNILIDYQVIISRQGRGEVTVQRIPTFLSSNSYSATELLAGVTYQVTLRGIYTDDVLGINSTVLATTLEQVPSGPPLNLSVTPLETALYLEWMPPHEDDRNGVIISYRIVYRLISGGLIRENLTASVSMLNQTSVTMEPVRHILRGVSAGSTYEVQVAALTAVGAGPSTSTVTVSTAQGRFSYEVAVSIAIGVGVALVAIALLATIVLCVYMACLVHRVRTRRGKHEPLVAAERGNRRDKKENIVKRKTVSGPIPGITPQIDYSVPGKFTVQGQNGKVLSLKPKIITDGDVAPPPRKGGVVQVVGRSQTVLAPSNDETDETRIDPYATPADVLKGSGRVPLRQKSSSPVQVVRKRASSGVYSEVSDVMKTPPTPQEDPERPYEDVDYDKSGDVWGRQAEEESEGSRDSFGNATPTVHEPHPPDSPERPEAPDTGRDDSHLVYASVSQDHVQKKREMRLKEEQREQGTETKQERKMREKLEREELKMEEKKRKKREKTQEAEKKAQERETKRMEAERKKTDKLRESMGLSNIVGYQDIDFSKPESRAQAEFIDSATASLF